MEPDKIAEAAQQMIEQQMRQRLAIIQKLVTAQETEDELLAKLAEVRQAHARDWAEAQRLGWSPRELRKLKLRMPGRPAGRSARTGKNATGNGTPSNGTTNADATAASDHLADEQPLPQPLSAAEPTGTI